MKIYIPHTSDDGITWDVWPWCDSPIDEAEKEAERLAVANGHRFWRVDTYRLELAGDICEVGP